MFIIFLNDEKNLFFINSPISLFEVEDVLENLIDKNIVVIKNNDKGHTKKFQFF